jgi:GTP-binding protein YchF
MRIGLIGLPASGKTTVFRLLTRSQATHPSGRPGEPSIAVVRIPDSRLDRLAALSKPKKITPVGIEFIDLPSLLRRPSRVGEADEQSLPQMRQADGFLAVVRAFEDQRVPLPEGGIDPVRDAAAIEAELLLADLDVVERRIGKIEEGVQKGRKDENLRELALLKRCREALEQDRPLRVAPFEPEEERLLRGFQLLTAKPILHLFNVGEGPGAPQAAGSARSATDIATPAAHLTIPAKLELELADLPPAEASAFRAEYGLGASAVPRLLQACQDLLGVVTFFTTVGDELRAWTVPRGATALKAAETIHTDMARGFIRAEVIAVEALIRCGGLAAARKEGLLRLEGKEYLVADGDVMTIRFSV